MRRQTVAQWVSLVVLLASLLVVDATAAPVDPIEPRARDSGRR